MPSPDSISGDLQVDVFGGLVTQLDPQALPKGASPFNQDVIYSSKNPAGTGTVAALGTRGGLDPFYAAPFTGNPSVNYIAEFADVSGVLHTLCLDSLGVVRDETPANTPPGVPTIIGQVVAASIAQSDSLIGQEWIAFSDVQHPSYGIDIPRHYNGTNFDRVSQVGPGAPPFASNLVSATTVNPAAGLGLVPVENNVGGANPIAAISKTGAVVTVVMGAAVGQFQNSKPGDQVQVIGNPGGYDGAYKFIRIVSTTTVEIQAASTTVLAPSALGNYFSKLVLVVVVPDFPVPPVAGFRVTIAGATDPAYNGTSVVRAVSGGGIYTMYIPGSSNVNSDTGTATVIGSIGVGEHLVSVSFVTRSQYITKPSPFARWTATGGLGVLLTQLPVGPANVIARIIMFTPVITPPAVLDNFYYLSGPIAYTTGIYPTMVVANNTDTSALCDFTDAVLILSQLATNLFRLIELGECAAVCTYSTRTFWVGERNKLQNLLNPTFDGGFNGTLPLGWYRDATAAGAGGSEEATDTVWQSAYKITGDGASVTRGRVYQSAYTDFLGVPILSPRTAYSVRVRLKKGGAIVAGNAVIDIESGGAVISSFSTPVANISSTEYTEFIGALLASTAAIPANYNIRVYLNGTPTLNGYVLFENIEVFPTAIPYNRDVIRVSYAGDPESIDSLTGLILPSDASSESMRQMFTLLDNKLYLVSDSGIYVTQDDGKNEPNRWAVNTVSSKVGTGSVLAIDVAESWAIITYTDGIYIFFGSEPIKISQEIEPTWNEINKAYTQKIYTLIDVANKRVIVGAPTGESNKCNREYVMDYSQLTNAEGRVTGAEIAAASQVYWNGTGLVSNGRARKWTVWNISANCAALVERKDGNFLLLRGNNADNGKVYNQLTIKLSDDGVAINSQYQFYYAPQGEEESNLGTHRKMCKYMTGYCFGVGTMTFTMYGGQNQRPMVLSSLTLANPAQADWEKNVNFVSERMSLLIGTNAVGSWFVISKLSMTIQKDLVSPVRGNIL